MRVLTMAKGLGVAVNVELPFSMASHHAGHIGRGHLPRSLPGAVAWATIWLTVGFPSLRNSGRTVHVRVVMLVGTKYDTAPSNEFAQTPRPGPIQGFFR